MKSGRIDGIDRAAFNALFLADWLFKPERISAVLPHRWEKLHGRMMRTASHGAPGRVLAVERRANLTPEVFQQEFFRTGIPVVLEGAAAAWPAIRKWTPEYLASFCGGEKVEVLDGQHWTTNGAADREAVSTTEGLLEMNDLLRNVKKGGAWYGAFLELLDKYPSLREDLDLSFVDAFGQTNRRIPWHRNLIAKMYVGGPGTSTSLHCAGVSNMYVQVHGRKRWVLIGPQFTPLLYPSPTRGLNWQSRIDFRNPAPECPLYDFVDRYETVLEPGDVLWNPPFVWHGVENLTESIAVSLWWVNVTRGFSNNFMLSALTTCGRPNPIAMQLGLSGARKPGASNFSVHLNK